MKSRLLPAAAVMVLMLAVPALADGGTPQVFSLKEALGLAYETNPELAAARAGQRATDENVAEANAAWRPQINATGTYSSSNYNISGQPGWMTTHPMEAQLTVTQPLFRGGRTYAGIGKAKAQVRSGRAGLIAAEQTVLLDAVTAYMDVVRDLSIVGLRRQNVEVLRKQRDATALEFKAGSVTRTDVAQSEARLAGAEADLTTAEGQLAVSHSNFTQIVGRPAETLEDIPVLPLVIPENEDTALETALHENPSMMAAREDEKAASYAVDEAEGALLPEVSVSGAYYYSQGSYTSALGTGAVVHGVGVTGQINVPIYQGGAEQAAVRKVKELHAQADINIHVADRNVRQAVSAAWNTWRAAQATIASNLATEKADEIAFVGVSKERQVGGRTILDVLNARQELLNAQVAVVTARSTAAIAAYRLLSAMGRLTAKSLSLEVKYYDPREHYDDDAARWIGF
jgi:outer membrane protein